MVPNISNTPVQATLPNGEKADPKTIAAKVSGMFMEMMIKTMEESVEAEDGLFGKSSSSEIYRGLFREQLGKALTDQLRSPFERQLEQKLDDAMPVKGVVTSPVGWRHDPISGELKFHKGTDIAAAYGSEVKAVAGGLVVESGEKGGYGNAVVIQTDDGRKMLYGHNAANLVRAGDRVESGATIAQVGSTGRATGPHVHFEVMD